MMKKLMSIALMAALSGMGMAALAQAPTPRPTPTPAPQTAPKVDPIVQTPRVNPQIPSLSSKETAPPAIAGSKEAQSELVELTAMDANRDGLVSRTEYMTHYEGLYGKFKKDSAGMISLKDLASSGSPIAAVQ
jgi:hypothetical protein